jgi:hypothetical protein
VIALFWIIPAVTQYEQVLGKAPGEGAGKEGVGQPPTTTTRLGFVRREWTGEAREEEEGGEGDWQGEGRTQHWLRISLLGALRHVAGWRGDAGEDGIRMRDGGGVGIGVRAGCPLGQRRDTSGASRSAGCWVPGGRV